MYGFTWVSKLSVSISVGKNKITEKYVWILGSKEIKY
jgi:hypothetical protein